ncbi:septum formation family protein [Microbacterium maritypicum]
MTIPAGWYDDGSGRRRWWDGSGWTQHTLAAPAPATATPEDAETIPLDGAVPDPALAERTSEAPESDPIDAPTADTADAAFTPPWVLPGTGAADQAPTPVAEATATGYASAGVAPHAAGVAPHAAGIAPGAVPPVPQPGWGAAGVSPGAAHPGWGAPVAAPSAPRPFPVLGVIALGLAVLGTVLSCVPAIAGVGWALLGLGFLLGVVSLFLRAPKWPGIAGMGLSVLGAFLAVAVVLISFGSTGSTTPETGGTPVAPPSTSPSDGGTTVPSDAETVAWSDLEVGQCMPYVEWEEDLYEVPVVPCDEPHTDEVYLTFDVEDGDFPGDDELNRIAEERCLSEFETFVGYSYAESELDFYWSVPTQRTWRWDDREVLCVAYSYDDVTGTLKGAGR